MVNVLKEADRETSDPSSGMTKKKPGRLTHMQYRRFAWLKYKLTHMYYVPSRNPSDALGYL